MPTAKTLRRREILQILGSLGCAMTVAPQASLAGEHGHERDHARWSRNFAWDWTAFSDRRLSNPQWAMQLARKAVELSPDDGVYLNTLGLAQYRAGEYAAAAETLAKSDAINANHFGGSLPCDVAFLAMTHHRLGHVALAGKFLEQLKSLLTTDRWKDDAEAQSFYQEALTLMASDLHTPVAAPRPPRSLNSSG